MPAVPEDEGDLAVNDDPLRHAGPAVDAVEAMRARAAIEARLFSGPPTPVKVGRYRIEGRIGSGGMGVVYRAHDPELARDVAVKVVSPEAVAGERAALARARLVREARAMARLAHPNVIHVYDVGTVDDGVFIAMELVEGQSLARWLAERHRDWRDILRAFVEAGRGLAAAHGAGIVHRDFKPENVLVAIDGRVRVVDFGLAGAPPVEPGETSADGTTDPLLGTSDDSDVDRGAIDIALTKTGSLLGTPKYIAPEQENGQASTPRSDQFSFCVALFEGLYGSAPYEGDTIAHYRKNVRLGNILPPPPDTEVPAWVHQEIVRGMSVAPEARHRDMNALLERLSAALEDAGAAARRRRTIRVGAGLMGAIAVALMVGWTLGRRPGPEPTRAPGLSERAPVVVVADRPLAETPPTAVPTSAPTEPAATSTASAPEAPSTESTPAPVASDLDVGSAPTPTRVTNRSGKRARGRHCYFVQDTYDFLLGAARHRRFVLADDGRCYDCRKAKNFQISASTPPEGERCSQFHICAPEDTLDQCEG